MTDADIEVAVGVLKSGKLTRGPKVEEFESEFARYVNKRYAIAVNSGTSGLHICVRALGWKDGDKVITTPFSFIASSNALLFERITPVFVDIDPKTLNIDLNKIKNKINSQIKGVLLVHILGLPVNYSLFKEIKNKYNLEIIEDSCEFINGKGASSNLKSGNFGIASVYAFHENKQLTTGGEGGMIVTDDFEFAEKCRSIRDQGRSNKKNWINNVCLGFNFRMTEMQAAIGISQLKRIDKTLDDRSEIAEYYHNLLKNTRGIVTPQDLDNNFRSWFVYYVLFDNEKIRAKIKNKLSELGIQTSDNYFPPIYKFPMYREYDSGEYKVTDDISKRLLVLPFFNGLTRKEVEYIVDKIRISLTG